MLPSVASSCITLTMRQSMRLTVWFSWHFFVNTNCICTRNSNKHIRNDLTTNAIIKTTTTTKIYCVYILMSRYLYKKKFAHRCTPSTSTDCEIALATDSSQPNANHRELRNTCNVCSLRSPRAQLESRTDHPCRCQQTHNRLARWPHRRRMNHCNSGV